MENQPRRRRSYAENPQAAEPPRPPVSPQNEELRRKVAPKAEHTEKKTRSGRVKKRVLLLIPIFAALMALLVIVSPKQPETRAQRTIATESGDVAEGAVLSDAYRGLCISEVMPSNRSAVPDETGAYADWVEIWNGSDHAIDLYGVGLSDDGSSIRFLFPDIVLGSDERILVFCDGTNKAVAGKPLHAKFKLSSSGETVFLFDPQAFLIDSCTYPIMGSDESWARQSDGSFAAMSAFSPGYPNGEEGYKAYREATMVTTGDLLINEVMADPVSGLADADGELCDWVEIHNTSLRDIDLSGFALSDKATKPLKWVFPEGTVIHAGEYLVVFCSGKDRVDAGTNVPHTNFRLSAEHETVILSDAYGRMIDAVTIDNLPEDCSWGRGEDGSFRIFTLATPGLPNTEAGANQMDYNLRRMNASGVWISEVMASNDSVATIEGAGFCDWVELYNSSSASVDLSGYGLSDNLGRPRKWQFPEGTIIRPGEYKIVFCDRKTDLTTASQLHAGFKIKRAGGEILCLSDPTGRVLDKLVLPEVPTNISYGRTIGMAGFFYYEHPTPGEANGSDGFGGYAQAPEITGTTGPNTGYAYTKITIPAGTSVFYTTDGSVPTRSSHPYNGETLEIQRTTVLRARAFSDGLLYPSRVTTGTFLISEYNALPFVCLTVDPDELWNATDGLLTAGPNVDKSGGIPFKNTIYRQFGKIPREAYIEYYALDGTQILSQGCEVALQGQYSLDMPQKTFKLRAKSLYGAKTFAAKLFEDREYTEYKSIVLRNSGNDCVWTRLLDGFQSRLLDGYGSQVIHQAWNPVVVYLNGSYWGHYNMRERVDRFFVAQHEGLPLSEASEMDIVEANSKAKYGSNAGYKAMLKKIKAGNPAKNPEDLQYILDNVDVDNYFEYIALEMFVGNSDPGNIRYYRLKREGSKWRWIFYDADYGLFNSSFNSPKSYLQTKGMGQQHIDNTILLKLLSVPEYKDKFLRKLGDIFQTFTTEYMLSVLEPMVAQIEPEMYSHWNRWAEENDRAIIAELPTSLEAAMQYWEKRVERLRNTIRKRPNLLWGYIKDAFKLSDKQMVQYFGERPAMPEGVT